MKGVVCKVVRCSRRKKGASELQGGQRQNQAAQLKCLRLTASRGSPSQTLERPGAPLISYLPQVSQNQVQKLISVSLGITTPTYFVPWPSHENTPRDVFHQPGCASHLPVHYHRVLHVLEQLPGLKQEGDVQNHIAVPWGEDGKLPSSSLQEHQEGCL